MDILIRNMEMPKEGHYYLEVFFDGEIRKCTNPLEGFVNTDATAIELPPHGRLVNLDDVYEAINRDIVPKGIFLSDFYKAFADIPTIVEASK